MQFLCLLGNAVSRRNFPILTVTLIPGPLRNNSKERLPPGGLSSNRRQTVLAACTAFAKEWFSVTSLVKAYLINSLHWARRRRKHKTQSNMAPSETVTISVPHTIQESRLTGPQGWRPSGAVVRRLSLQLWSCGGHHPEQCVQKPGSLPNSYSVPWWCCNRDIPSHDTNDSQTLMVPLPFPSSRWESRGPGAKGCCVLSSIPERGHSQDSLISTHWGKQLICSIQL